MYGSVQDAAWARPIDLAQEVDFDLGSLRVRPARCEVEFNGASQTLQRRVMQVLVVLAQAGGSVVSQSDLVARCWRGLSVSDDAIYRCISQLRKLAATYPGAPFSIEAVPGVGYRLTSAHVDEAGSTASPVRFRALLIAVALLVVVLAGAAFRTLSDRFAEERPVRVAVRPFDTLTNSNEARALARRIPNELVNEFGDSQIVTALVEERTANQAAWPSGLNVTGLVRDDASNVSVDVRVEDGSSHVALWSMQFKCDRAQASDLPMEVAARVADVVNMAIFARGASPPLTDDSALSALLQVNDMIRDPQGADWAQMIERAQSVVARHPEFAFGHDVLSVAYREASESEVPDRAPVMKEAARREANLTLKMDPQDAGAYVVLAELEAPGNYRAQEAILLRGLRLARHPKQPLGRLYSYESTLLSNVGRLREALSSQLVARATDEWGPPKTAQLARLYANMGNMPEAQSWIQKGVQIWPNHSGVRRAQRYIVGFYQQPSDALAVFRRLNAEGSPDDDEAPVWRTFIQARLARDSSTTALAIRDIREAADRSRISPENAVMMMAGLGDPREAIKAANRALDRHEALEPWFLFAPISRSVRQDPGFVQLAARLGLIDYWRETGKWPDFCTHRTSECSPQLLAALKR